MDLAKTSLWQGLATVFKIMAGLVTTKIIAIYVGPVGIALLGNFSNATSILLTFANGGITSGVTKYIAEYETEHDRQQSVVALAVKVNLVCSAIIGVLVLIFHTPIAMGIFRNTDYSSVIVILGMTIVFYGLNTTISAVLNGYRQIKYLIITGMIASALSVVLAAVITIQFGMFGALINSIIAQICIFLVNIYFVRRLKLFELEYFRIRLDRQLLWKLFKYAIMSLVTVMVMPTSMIIIRSHIYNSFSPNEAGFIQGVWVISGAYLMVVTTTLSTYYLPTLSAIKEEQALRAEIFKGYKFLLPLAAMGGISVFLCRDFIIHVLYTPEFMPMREYFAFQVVGDFFKIASWILAFIMLAKAMTRWFIISEIIFASSNVGLSFLFMHYFGSVGVTYAYAMNYFIYLLFMMWLFRRYLFIRKTTATTEN